MRNKLVSDIYAVLRHLKRQGFWVFSGRVYLMAAGLISSMLFARLLTVNDYGEYKYILASLAMLAVFSLPETHQVIIRYVPKGFNSIYGILFRERLTYSCIGSALILFAAIFYFHKGSIGLSYFCVFLALVYPLYYSFQVFDPYLQAELKFKELNFFYVARITLQVISVLVSYIIFESIYMSVAIMLVAVTSINLVAFQKVKKLQSLKSKTIPETIQKQAKKESLVLSIITILPIFVAQFDKILVARIIDYESLAIYSIGIALGTAINGFFKPFMSTLNAKLVNVKLENRHYFLAFISGSLIGLVVSYAMPSIALNIYGESYWESSTYAQIIVLSMGLYFWQTLYYNHNMFYKHKSLKNIYTNNVSTPLLILVYMTVVVHFSDSNSEILWLLTLIYPIKLSLSIFTIFILSLGGSPGRLSRFANK